MTHTTTTTTTENNACTYEEAMQALKTHKKADTNDIKCVIKTTNEKYGWSERVHADALKLGAPVKTLLSINQKQVKRFAQLMSALSAERVKTLDYTHARVLIAMRAAGAYNLTRDAVAALAANKIIPGTETRGVTRAQVNALFKNAHGLSTVETKISNSVGDNGFMTICKMVTHKGHKNAEFSLDLNHPITRKFFEVIDGATEGQLRELAEGEDK